MKFSQFANHLKKIEEVSSRLAITELVAELFKHLSVAEIAVVPYLFAGKVAPDYRGIEFGIAEKTVIKAFASCIAKDAKEVAAYIKQKGDLGLGIEELKNKNISLETADLDLLDVYREFVQLTKLSGDGSVEQKCSILSQLFASLDGLSCRFIARIPLGAMRLGFSDITILDALSWMLSGGKTLRPQIEKAYQVRPDLGFICKTVKEHGVSALATVRALCGTPILMMKAERLSSGAEIVEELGECMLEPKYDGLRLQVHKSGHVVSIFTRGLENATTMYPDIVAATIKELHDINEIIFEGEALGYNFDDKKFLSFQETITRKRKHDIAEAAQKIPLRLMVFDVLQVNEQSIIDLPFETRRTYVEKYFKSDLEHADNLHILTCSPALKTKSASQIEKLFDEYLSEGLEGIMAKKLADPYKPGARANSWVKLKRSYNAKIDDTIDCVLMGYDAGRGKRAQFGIGALLVGVYDSLHDKYMTIAKIGTGIKDEDFVQIKKLVDKSDLAQMPAEYECATESMPDVFVKPKYVLEIRADEITTSKLHTSGYSLRFPRLVTIREKKPQDATHLSEIPKIAKEIKE